MSITRTQFICALDPENNYQVKFQITRIRDTDRAILWTPCILNLKKMSDCVRLPNLVMLMLLAFFSLGFYIFLLIIKTLILQTLFTILSKFTVAFLIPSFQHLYVYLVICMEVLHYHQQIHVWQI